MINCKSFIDLMIEKWYSMRWLLGALKNVVCCFQNSEIFTFYLYLLRSYNKMDSSSIWGKYSIETITGFSDQFHFSSELFLLVLKILEPDAAIRMQDWDETSFLLLWQKYMLKSRRAMCLFYIFITVLFSQICNLYWATHADWILTENRLLTH